MAAIKTMGLMETGHHLKEPVFNLVEVTGFVLDPDPRAKYMSVDGEAVRKEEEKIKVNYWSEKIYMAMKDTLGVAPFRASLSGLHFSIF
jgi:hypothetical protein